MRRKIFLFAVIFAFIVFPAESAVRNAKDFYKSLSRRLGRDRQNYSYLTDREFANFREVTTTGIGHNKLYRSSSPVKNWGNRNLIADKLAQEAGVKTFINLADSSTSIKEYPDFDASYYSKQNIICLNLSTKFFTGKFRKTLARGIRFMINNEPPYLIHCDLGKDRAGFVCALIECLMGASANEVVSDFLISFYNYFGIVPDSDPDSEYNFVADNEIRAFLAKAFGVKSIYNANLQECAEKYFIGLGLTVDEIESLRNKLKP
ncbi:MAG: tyrosine-protein phosphatase [Synergistaceae bacterium]|nr:tyrosine-protein phosphatase [Synergistaceae bacterium]